MNNWRDKMDVQEPQSSQQAFNEELDLEPLTQKHDKKLVLSTEAERMAISILNRRHRVAELNKNIDPTNTALRFQLSLKVKELRAFQHFLTKNKHRHERVQVMQVVRDLSEQKNYVLNGRVKDKLQRSRMVLRVISKQDLVLVMVQDETGKEKMIVRNGTVWVGMIALMQVTWADNSYKLQAVLDLGTRAQKINCELKLPAAAYRMLFVKGSFMNHQSVDKVGLKILISQIKHLRDKEKTRISSLVIMGPLLSRKNKALAGFMETTYEEQMVELTKVIRDEINKINQQIEIVFVPSTEDITNYYPIPQPKYTHHSQIYSKTKTTHFTSNPGFIHLINTKQSIKLDLINMDLLNYIDENRTGRSVIEIMQENLDTYFKQPFYLTNALQQPFDQTNLPALYNEAKFGDIIVTSSNKAPPFAREVRGKVFLNIGSLRMQEGDETQQHFMTLVSIFEGNGNLSSRTKVEKLEM